MRESFSLDPGAFSIRNLSFSFIRYLRASLGPSVLEMNSKKIGPELASNHHLTHHI